MWGIGWMVDGCRVLIVNMDWMDVIFCEKGNEGLGKGVNRVVV